MHDDFFHEDGCGTVGVGFRGGGWGDGRCAYGFTDEEEYKSQEKHGHILG